MRKMLLLLLIIMPGLLFAQTTYTIHGRFYNIKQPVKTVYLLRMVGLRQVIDSAQVNNNEYELTGSATAGDKVIMLNYKFASKMPDMYSMCQFFLAPETFTIAHTNTFNKQF